MKPVHDIRIAFFDIDGTLVSFTSHRVPDSTLFALETLTRKGVEIVIATGRGAEPIKEILDVPYSAIIGLNGSECALKDGSILYRHTIPADMFERVLALAKEFDFAVAAKFKDGFAVDRITSRVAEMSARIASPCPPIMNLREVYENEGTSQMCIFTDADTERRVMHELPLMSSSRWCDTFADLNLKGIDKGRGVSEFLRLRGVGEDNAISFGDGGNDVTMFNATGISVAMGNSAEEVKDAAVFVTDDVDNDGIYNALRYFGLI